MTKHAVNLQSSIAKRYSDALIGIAEDNNSLDQTLVDLKLAQSVLVSVPELNNALNNPIISFEDKKSMVDEIFANQISKSLINFIKILIDNNKISVLDSIIAIYEKTLNSKRNIAVAEVTSAIGLDDETVSRLKDKLQTVFKKEINLNISIDKDIIAGLVVRVDDQIIDGSVKTKLETMKKQLI